jgi:glucokinase
VGLLLGIDVGGTKVAFGLGDAAGALRATHRRPTASSGDATKDVAAMVEDCRRLLAEAGVAPGEVDAVGVSIPSPFDPVRGVVLNPPNLPGWHDVPMRDLLQEALGMPVFLENDANAAALAEWHFGAAKGLEHVVYLTMSTGVGGGLILGGRLHRGVLGGAGEVGHVPVEWGGELCKCGLHGCLEAYVGGASWAQHLRRVTPADGRVAVLAGGREAVRPEHLVAAAREGDAFALAEMARWNEYVARGIVALVFTLAPQAVVLGTIAAAAGETLALRPIRERVVANVWPLYGRNLAILPAALGSSLPYHAAISAALEGLRSG